MTVFSSAVFVGYLLTKPLQFPHDNTFHLKPGESVHDLANMMKRSGHITRTEFVVWTARIGNFERSLKAGEYRFEPHFSILDVLDHIVQGRSIYHPVLLVEGWTFEEFLKALRSKPNIKQTLMTLPIEEIPRALKLEHEHPEGWFFPNTYHFNSGQTDASILLTAHDSMKTVLEEEWQQRKMGLPYQSAYEALIVASIIQKESNVPSEFPIIAGVIVNRLNTGMRLQMDPTVIYGLAEFDGTIRRSHLDTDTPYNTYTRHGLPPTPIAMPGRLAIRAAAQPAETDALYFVSAGDGTHVFSETLEEHLKAVHDYRMLMNR